ncbi:MAG: ABC transporter ATP-binding protein, partial [Clostridia bacterium]|nr:ABC transporter ATP-binding protein [Clostridia bacterium]
MLKRLAKCVREYKIYVILTLIFIVCEAIIETLIPFITATLINDIKAGAQMSEILKTGGLLTVMAILSLSCGGIAGFTCAKASSGFSKNLRNDLFAKIQTYAFGNIDRFSTSSLVTRLTTDTSNVQMSFMMIIRTAIRSPLMLIFSIVMAFTMGGMLAMSFVVVIPVLAFGLIMIGSKAMPAFRAVFHKYDRLNESIEENVRAMRVVKGFSREDYEKEKFGASAENIRGDFTRAERIVALNTPLMQICMYVNMVFILFMGSKLAITTAEIDVGHISAMLNYGMQILMSLMMLSMIYVMITMSTESAKRIMAVLEETPTLTSPENAVTEVKDGSIEFQGVSFKYSENAQKFALADIDLCIESGMTVGIIGGTGSSKSSLVQLIPRLYDVTEGCVKVGGVDVRAYDVAALRDSVAMVLQKNLLFSGTIREN